MHRRSTLREYFESLVLSVIVVLFARTFVAEAVQVPTGSMENTLLPGDHLFINKFTFRNYGEQDRLAILPYTEVRRKDVVVFRFFSEPHESAYFVKRVVGLPGETLEIRAKLVFINGKLLDEPYAVFKEPSKKDLRPRDFMGPVRIPTTHYFVMGDNRDRSYDSRFWGPLPRRQIVGKPLVVWWSFDSGLRPAARREGYGRIGWFLLHFFPQTRWDRTGKAIE